MIQFGISIDGKRYRCEAHTYPVGEKLLIECPGLAPFDADSIDDARDRIRSALRKEANQ